MLFKKKFSAVLSAVLAITIFNSAVAGYALNDNDKVDENDAETVVEVSKEKDEIQAKNVTVTFFDGDEELLQTELKSGAKLDEIPEKDSLGNDIIAWVLNGKRVEDPVSESVTEDSEFYVWHAPELLDQHKPYMSGYDDASFAPNKKLTRSEFCAIYNSLFDIYDNGCAMEFEDISEDAWYKEYVSKMVASGVINGYNDKEFAPDKPLTRAEFVAVICRAYDVKENESPFNDIDGHWAKNQIVFAYNSGWISGYDNGSFNPDGPITRAEAVSVFNKLLGRSAQGALASLKSHGVCPFYDVKMTDWYYADIMEAVLNHVPAGEENKEIWQDYEIKKSGYNPGIARVNGKGCYVNENGQFVHQAQNEFVWLSGKMYRTTADGLIELSRRGLCEIDGNMYCYADDGSLLVNANFEHLYFGADGKYTCGNAELDGLVDAALAACTNDSMSQVEKLRAAYLYVRDNFVYLNRSHHPRGVDTFVEESATFMFKNRKGNCYCFASCFLLMARRIGCYDAYIVSGGVGTRNSDHAWVMIGSKIFDPELEYAYRYRYATKRYYNLYDMSIGYTPFIYYFPN